MNTTLPEPDWDDILRAWMHDPFDKALSVQGHESRAARYASAALGQSVSRRGLHRLAAQPDLQSAIAERLPSPHAGPNGERAVGVADGLVLTHPTSGAMIHLQDMPSPEPDRAVALIESIVDGLPGPRERFLAVWRMLPDRIAIEFGTDAARLPADTRIPDHTLFQHVDITAGLHAAGATQDVAFLSFVLGPVRRFIEAARSVRDLWSGSALLSWIAFQAMQPILKCLGPTAFVYPSLRGAPLVDLWLIKEAGLGDRLQKPALGARMAPSLPHRFTAVVPWGRNGEQANALREACLSAARDGWRRVATAVRTNIDSRLARIQPEWDRLWSQQIESALDFRVAVVPDRDLSDERLARLFGCGDFSSAWPQAQRVRDLATVIPPEHRPGYDQDHAGRWQAQTEFASRLMAAQRIVRHVPESGDPGTGPSPGKCTLFGSWEQMGPAEYRPSLDFWRDAARDVSINGVRLRPRERLCAVALTKRFAGPALLASELAVEPADLRFPDTATVAAAEWLAKAGIDHDRERRVSGTWSGLWLHWNTRYQDAEEQPVPVDLWSRICRARTQQGRAPSYYAAISMDGDEMGRWLAGEKTPELRRLLHPKVRGYFESLDDERAEAGLSAPRPVGPALHGAISAALGVFASEVAPQIVAQHHGTMVYSGGDEVLALCPVATALRCIQGLRRAFSGVDDSERDGWRECDGRRRITMGDQASMSGGLAVIHYHEDLRLALETVRGAERRAKQAGRNLLDVVTARRSGETARAICPWPTDWLDGLRNEFARGASDRWTYRLRTELPALASGLLPRQALQAEIRRLIDRGESDTAVRCDGAVVADTFKRYGELRKGVPDAELLSDFLTLCQSASFMARGSDGRGS